MILIVYAHPHPGRSEANRVLLDAVRDLRGVRVHSLYDRYPDFAIDPAAEHAMLEPARLVVWQHPLYWYSVPALLKLWFESVLVRGWAYGRERPALAGKDCMWVTTTGSLRGRVFARRQARATRFRPSFPRSSRRRASAR